ncbi:MAG: PspC domain-containing protein [Candidatus Andersenbacteria bacterium]
MNTEPKKLNRSSTKKVLAGVCGGLGEYSGIDPVVIRLIWALVVVFTGFVPGVLVYIIAIFLIPLDTKATTL